MNLQLANALDFWQKQYKIHDDGPDQLLELLDGVDLGALSFHESVMGHRPIYTRAGLYIYLNAMVIESLSMNISLFFCFFVYWAF